MAERFVDPRILVCRNDDKSDVDGTSSYISAFDLAERSVSAWFIGVEGYAMIWDSEPRHKGHRNVVFFDGHVGGFTEEEFAPLLERLRRVLAEH